MKNNICGYTFVCSDIPNSDYIGYSILCALSFKDVWADVPFTIFDFSPTSDTLYHFKDMIGYDIKHCWNKKIADANYKFSPKTYSLFMALKYDCILKNEEYLSQFDYCLGTDSDVVWNSKFDEKHKFVITDCNVNGKTEFVDCLIGFSPSNKDHMKLIALSHTLTTMTAESLKHFSEYFSRNAKLSNSETAIEISASLLNTDIRRFSWGEYANTLYHYSNSCKDEIPSKCHDRCKDILIKNGMLDEFQKYFNLEDIFKRQSNK